MTTKNEKKIEGIDRDKVEYTDAERETVQQYMGGKMSLTLKELKKISIKVNLDQNIIKKQIQQYFKDYVEFAFMDIIILFRIFAAIQANIQIGSPEFYSSEFQYIVQFRLSLSKEKSAVSLVTQSPANKMRGNRNIMSFSHNGNENHMGDHAESFISNSNGIQNQLPRYSLNSHNVTHLKSGTNSINNTLLDNTKINPDDIYLDLYENSKSDTSTQIHGINDFSLLTEKYEFQHANHYQNYQFDHYKNINLYYLAMKHQIATIKSNVNNILEYVQILNNTYKDTMTQTNSDQLKTVDALKKIIHQEQQTVQWILTYYNNKKQTNVKLQHLADTFQNLQQVLHNKISIIVEAQSTYDNEIQNIEAQCDILQKKKLILMEKIKKQQALQLDRAKLLGFLKYYEHQVKDVQNVLSSASHAAHEQESQKSSAHSFWKDAEDSQYEQYSDQYLSYTDGTERQ